MKLLHISDLHLGKKLREQSLIEDQKFILGAILDITDGEKPDGVIIAGDVYDKSVPSAEAVELFDDFLVKLSRRTPHVFVISGNHDSPERLAFGGRLMERSGIHISPVFGGEVVPVELDDDFGKAGIYLLPFVKPANVRRFFPDEPSDSYTDAVRTVISHMNVPADRRNILVTHQFVTGAERCESEEVSVGGADNIDASVFDMFDYVALGHIHGPQNIGSDRIRYCGSPLKYSFSEASHRKSVTVIELAGKGELSVRTVPLVPLHDMIELKGKYDELTLRDYYESIPGYMRDRDIYVHVTLTDEEDVPEAMSKLRVIYPNILKLDYDNTRTRHEGTVSGADDIENKTPLTLFSEFYEKMNGTHMTEAQESFVGAMIEKVWEEKE